VLRTALLFVTLFVTSVASSGLLAAERSILVVGDSLSAAYGLVQSRGWVALLGERLKRERPDYSVVNASISRDTTGGGLAGIDRLAAEYKPAVVVPELGGNDGLRGLPVAEMRNNLASMIERSQKAGAKVVVVGVYIPPNYGPDYTKEFFDTFGGLA